VSFVCQSVGIISTSGGGRSANGADCIFPARFPGRVIGDCRRGPSDSCRADAAGLPRLSIVPPDNPACLRCWGIIRSFPGLARHVSVPPWLMRLAFSCARSGASGGCVGHEPGGKWIGIRVGSEACAGPRMADGEAGEREYGKRGCGWWWGGSVGLQIWILVIEIA
jgi:hypothetical protein